MLNFRGLKERMLSGEGAGQRKARPEQVKLNAGPDGQNSMLGDVPLVGSRLMIARQAEIKPSDSIVDTCYCLGCLRASVDYPGTDQETWYCHRDPVGGVVVFKRVDRSVRVRQCRYRVETDGGESAGK